MHKRPIYMFNNLVPVEWEDTAIEKYAANKMEKTLVPKLVEKANNQIRKGISQGIDPISGAYSLDAPPDSART